MPFVPTSDATAEYTCISWAVMVTNQVIWPDEDEQLGWPETLAREETQDAFRQFFILAGFAACDDGSLTAGIEKIAVYVKDGRVTHAARQLENGQWTSKMGPWADGSHSLTDLENDYGAIAFFMARRRTGLPPVLPLLHPGPARLIAPGGEVLIR